jgi:hypothetical protein
VFDVASFAARCAAYARLDQPAMSERTPKKSETIEIRLDLPMKAGLQRRARLEGRSVSDILRELIARYLDDPSVSATRSILMRFSAFAMAAAAVAFSIVSLTTPATASDLSLGLRGMIDTGGAPPFVPQPDSATDLDFGRAQTFCVPRESREPVTLSPQAEGAACDGYSVLVWAEPGGTDFVRVGLRLLRVADAADYSRDDHGVLVPVNFGEQGEVLTVRNDMPVAVRITFFVQRPH